MEKYKFNVTYIIKGTKHKKIDNFFIYAMMNENWQVVQSRLVSRLSAEYVLLEISYKGLIFTIPAHYLDLLLNSKLDKLTDNELKLSFNFIKNLPENYHIVTPSTEKSYFSELNDVDPEYVGDVVELQINNKELN